MTTRKTKTIKTIETLDVPETSSLETVIQTNRDTLTALLIVSLMINLFIIVGWVTLQVTSAYDSQIASFLFTR